MTDDKEERRYLELTKFEWEHGYAAYLNRTELMLIFKRPRIEWSELPLAPKHTDEEYAELLMLWEAQAVTIASMLHHEDKYRLRIKELGG